MDYKAGDKKVHGVAQGSREWHSLRADHYTASEAAAMLGVSRHTKRSELLRMKATGVVPDVGGFQQEVFNAGHDAEDKARPIAEEMIGCDLYPATVTRTVAGMPLLASCDGITMDDKMLWEHKLINKNLLSVIVPSDLGEEYRAQMEQQMLVTGAEKCLFMASDGTAGDMTHVYYESDADLRKRIVDGWVQFNADLDEYRRKLDAGEIEQQKPKLPSEPIADLPALSVTATGMITRSNLPEFKAAAEQYIASINTELVTDQHFADAEATVKFCKKTEKKLEATRAAVLAQTASIDDVIRTVNHIQAQLRDKRLMLGRLVKSEKDARKLSLVREAGDRYAAHVGALQAEIIGVRIDPMLAKPDFGAAIQGLKSPASMQDALDTALANGKIAANAVAQDVRAKLAWCNGTAAGYSNLFPDLQQIITKPIEEFTLTITRRIEEMAAATRASDHAAECPSGEDIIECIAAHWGVSYGVARDWIVATAAGVSQKRKIAEFTDDELKDMFLREPHETVSELVNSVDEATDSNGDLNTSFFKSMIENLNGGEQKKGVMNVE